MANGSDSHNAVEDELRRLIEQERLAREVAEKGRRDAEVAYDRLRRLQALSAALSESITPEEVSEAVIRHGAGYLEADAGGILVPTRDGAALQYLFGRGYQHFESEGSLRRFELSEAIPISQVFSSGEPLLFESRDELRARFPALFREGIVVDQEATAVLPLDGKGARIGVLLLSWQKPRRFDEDSRASLRILSLHTAQALDRANLYATLDGERRRLAAVIQQMPSAVAIVEVPSAKTLLANGQNAAIFRMSAPEARNGVKHYGAFKGLHPDGRPFAPEDWPLARSIRGEVVKGEEIHIIRGDGSHGFIRANSAPVRDEAGEIIAAVVIYDDITDQRRTDDDVRFLAAASKVLSSSLDWQTTLRTVCDLAVPTLADWCAIELIRPDGVSEPIAVAHQDPAKVQFAQQLRQRFPPDPKKSAVRTVMETGEHILFERVTDDLLKQTAQSEEHLEILREVGMASALVVPIPTRRGVIGAFTLVSAEMGRTFTERDVPLFLELGQRAGLAIENARLYAEAQAAVQKRDDFLSVASHELKTPLTSLDLHIESLRRTAERGALADLPVEKVTEKLNAIERQSERLRTLVEDLLDVARISAGKMTLAREETDLVALGREVVSRFSAQAARAGVEIHLHADESVVGSWDKGRIDQVVVNLLTNAVKYGGRNPVDITVRRAAGKAILSVRDRGIGIAQEDQTRIFGRFERASSVRSFGGIGLGLWICKQIVDAHGGTITVESELGCGSTFTVELP